jgi:hypothetical protein
MAWERRSSWFSSAFVAVSTLQNRYHFKDGRRLCILSVPVKILRKIHRNFPLYLSNGCTVDYNRHLGKSEISIILHRYGYYFCLILTTNKTHRQILIRHL